LLRGISTKVCNSDGTCCFAPTVANSLDEAEGGSLRLRGSRSYERSGESFLVTPTIVAGGFPEMSYVTREMHGTR